jgi:hypothetical protein
MGFPPYVQMPKGPGMLSLPTTNECYPTDRSENWTWLAPVVVEARAGVGVEERTIPKREHTTTRMTEREERKERKNKTKTKRDLRLDQQYQLSPLST